MLRNHYLDKIVQQLRVHAACGLLGPRQVGKTTLAKEFSKKYYPDSVYFFDLENPYDLAQLENPMLTLSQVVQDLVVIDEVQLRPDLFPVLRVLIDRNIERRSRQKFLILGSASRDLIRQSSETLAGRIGYLELMPFCLLEVPDQSKLWLRGGFPLSYLAETDQLSYLWRQSYITTFLERDVPSLGFGVPPAQLRRFWLMLCHYHGQIFNASEIGRSLAVSHHTTQSYLDILAGTFMIRVLQPWFENLKKRQVKSPKIYFRDSGILNALMGFASRDQILTNPKLGAMWEGFALEQIICAMQVRSEDCYFWATQASAELDLLIFKNGQRVGFEIKYTDAPKMTASMHIAMDDLRLDHLFVVYPGDRIFPMADKVTAGGLSELVLELNNKLKF